MTKTKKKKNPLMNELKALGHTFMHYTHSGSITINEMKVIHKLFKAFRYTKGYNMSPKIVQEIINKK